MRGYYGAATPAPVPYSKQTDQFLIGVAEKYGAELESIEKKLASKTISAAEKKTLSDRQLLVNKNYYIPAKQELNNRMYSVIGSKVTKIGGLAKSTSSVIPSKSTLSPAMIVIALAAAGAYWWFKVRKVPVKA